MKKIMFVDTETNGLPLDFKKPSSNFSNWPRIVQIAWLVVDGQQNVLREMQFIVKPEGWTISEDSKKIHGIDQKKAETFGVHIDEVVRIFMRDVSSVDRIVAHNVDFDKNVIEAEFSRTFFGTFSGKEFYCTKEKSVDILKIPGPYGYKWPKLVELHKHFFGTEISGAHDAMVDVKACAKCYWKMIDPKEAKP